MNYEKNYFDIIDHCLLLNRKKDTSKKGYYHLHHILPKSIFPEYKNLKKNSWNVVLLTPREHLLIHYLLWKIYPTSTELLHAFFSMTNNLGIKVSSRMYERLQKQYANFVSQKMTNRYVSDETKHKISVARTGVKNPITVKRNSTVYCGGGNPRAIKIICAETKVVYNCIKDAVKQTGIKNLKRALNNFPRTAGCYHWFTLQYWTDNKLQNNLYVKTMTEYRKPMIDSEKQRRSLMNKGANNPNSSKNREKRALGGIK